LPFDPGPSGLRSELVEAGLRFPSPKGKTESKIIWLPTLEGKPSLSSPLIAELPDREEQVKKAVIRPWMITVLPLPMEKAVEFLGLCIGKSTLGPGLIIGKDLAFWSQALRFAGALLARQKFLPALIEKKDRKNLIYMACWRPILSGPDQDRLNKLVKALPQIGRALTEEALVPPDTASLTVLSRFIHKTVDYMVRSAAGNKAERQRLSLIRKDNGDSLHDQWIRALQDPFGNMEGSPADFQKLAQQIRDRGSQPFFSPFRISGGRGRPESLYLNDPVSTPRNIC
jgi:hypothetical protein